MAIASARPPAIARPGYFLSIRSPSLTSVVEIVTTRAWTLAGRDVFNVRLVSSQRYGGKVAEDGEEAATSSQGNTSGDREA
jgi:hypothetical protein